VTWKIRRVVPEPNRGIAKTAGAGRLGCYRFFEIARKLKVAIMNFSFGGSMTNLKNDSVFLLLGRRSITFTRIPLWQAW
jgi:hypothetical protein